MVGQGVAADALVVAAIEGRRQAEMRGAPLLPEPRILGPLRLVAGAHRDPHLDADLGRVAAGLFGLAAQLAKDAERGLIRRIGVRHPAIAEFGDALDGPFVMTAEPHRYLAGSGARVDAGILERMPTALESDVRRGPQLLHDLPLLLGAAAAIVEVFVETDEFDLVPADTDPEPEPAAAQRVEAGGLLGDQRGLTLRQDQHAGREAELRGHSGQI